MGGGWNIIEAVLLLPKDVYQAAAICGMIAEAITAPTAGQRWTEVLTMTLTEMFTICDSCVYAPCLCGNDPENCVAYVMRTSDNGSHGERKDGKDG